MRKMNEDIAAADFLMYDRGSDLVFDISQFNLYMWRDTLSQTIKEYFLARLKKYFSEGQRQNFLYQYLLTPFKFIEKNYRSKRVYKKVWH